LRVPVNCAAITLVTGDRLIIILRIVGIALVLLGLVFCLTIIGATVGIPMMMVGAILAFVGKKRAPIVVNINHDPKS
jgi:type IV secretory pathway TrbD component